MLCLVFGEDAVRRQNKLTHPAMPAPQFFGAAPKREVRRSLTSLLGAALTCCFLLQAFLVLYITPGQRRKRMVSDAGF